MRTTDKRAAPVVGIVVLATGLALMTALSWQAAGHLADPVLLAGTGKGGADQHAPKALVLAGLPVLTAALAVLLLLGQRLRRFTAGKLGIAEWRDDRTHRKGVDLALGVVVPVLAAVHLTLLRAAEGELGPALGYVAAAVALVVVIVGNVWPKQAPAVPEFLAAHLSPRARHGVDTALEAQRRNLRPAGVAMVLLGLVALVSAWFAPGLSLALSMIAILVMGAIPLVTAVRSVRAG
ncbi:hypothetical protein [Actinoplanes sp. G11-F43]|uniref:hypothetical protein n=1 Tax=Actinoplanes sp. G11-F43 TaxID=3424130 RepID=UPI003D33B1B7